MDLRVRFIFSSNPASQFSNKFMMLEGGIILKAMCTMRHTYFAKQA
jgi:hypothetical protein